MRYYLVILLWLVMALALALQHGRGPGLRPERHIGPDGPATACLVVGQLVEPCPR